MPREEKVKELRFHLESAARELSIERFSSFESALFQAIFTFVKADDLICKKAGIMVIIVIIIIIILITVTILIVIAGVTRID